jgi:hypothetical protein
MTLIKVTVSALIMILVIFEYRQPLFLQKELPFQITLAIGVIFDLGLIIIPSVCYAENTYMKGPSFTVMLLCACADFLATGVCAYILIKVSKAVHPVLLEQEKEWDEIDARYEVNKQLSGDMYLVYKRDNELEELVAKKIKLREKSTQAM